jgi:Peptidase family M1 domain
MQGAGPSSLFRVWAAFFIFVLFPPWTKAQETPSAPAEPASQPSPHQTSNLADPRALYDALNGLRVDPNRVYPAHDLSLRRDVVTLSFADGEIGFLQALDGRISGAVFTGSGHVIGLPHDAGERRSLAKYIGVPMVDQPITKAYLRFTDDSAAELMRQLQSDGAQATPDPAFTENWDKLVPGLAPSQSLRTMTDWLSTDPLPYFYALMESDRLGAFDVLVDPRREEQVTFGQPRGVNGIPSYDVWASFRSRDSNAQPVETFAPVSYAVDSTIKPDFSLDGKTTLRLKAVRGGERVIPLELSRTLEVKQVQLADGHPLVFFQDDQLGQRDVLRRGNDFVLVILPEAARPGEEIDLAAEYSGYVIGDAGNGVKYVGERGAWYLHTGGIYFVPFDLRFRWPKAYTLVATGTNIESHDDGDSKTGHWQSREPFSVAGFNLGEYRSATVSGPPQVELFANLQLENAIAARLSNGGGKSVSDAANVPAQIIDPYTLAPQNVPLLELPAPSPAGVLKQLGRQVSDSVQFFEKTNGPFPFDHLDVAQIPGTFGQGWPQLVYLSTLAFLPPEAQDRAGMDEWSERETRELMPFHEVVHQWWGNVAAAASYRDVWLEEGMANYMAILYADSRKPGDHRLAKWLEHYRAELLAKPEGSHEMLDEAGPLSLGLRLNGFQPRAYNVIVYGKGAWVIYMLSEMFRDPAAKDPDEKFRTFLRAVLEKYRFRAITTDDFEREAEQYMTPAMDLEGSHRLNWFFEQWVNHTGIPRYSVKFTTKPKAQEFQVSGTLTQDGVEDGFTERVPLYITHGAGKPEFLGNVVTSGAETQFHFTSKTKPGHLVVDPFHTLLCQFE